MTRFCPVCRKELTPFSPNNAENYYCPRCRVEISIHIYQRELA